MAYRAPTGNRSHAAPSELANITTRHKESSTQARKCALVVQKLEVKTGALAEHKSSSKMMFFWILIGKKSVGGGVKKSITSSLFNRITLHLAVRCSTFQQINV